MSAVAVLALAVFPAGAGADLAVNVTATPVVSARQRTLEVVISIANHGSAKEWFSLGVEPSNFISTVQGSERIEGVQFALSGVPEYSGLTEGYGMVANLLIGCTTQFHMYPKTVHGWWDYMKYFQDLSIAGGATGWIKLNFAVWTKKTWLSLDPRPKIALRRELISKSEPTLDADIPVTLPPVRVNLPVAAEISFRTTPPISPISYTDRLRNVPLGRHLKIRGKIARPLKRRRVIFDYLGPKRRDVTFARAFTARTDARGRFATHWLPPGRGVYQLWARYPKQAGGLAQDRLCPVGFRVNG